MKHKPDQNKEVQNCGRDDFKDISVVLNQFNLLDILWRDISLGLLIWFMGYLKYMSNYSYEKLGCCINHCVRKTQR